jgi:CheY-like chemotaxis protein
MFTEEWVVCGLAKDGREAVEMARTLKPDVILLDFQMPNMNGLEAARRIIADDPSLPVAMYTLNKNEFFERLASAAGVRKVISKTEIFSSLLPSLKEILNETDSDRRAAD